MKCVFGFIPYKGTITLDGEPITPKNITRLSFATCEHSFFPNLSPESHRQFYQEHFPNFRDKRFRALLDFFELPAHKPARSFSTGQKNQLEVILALSQGADYILMDEPFAGNDVFNREDFYKVLLGILEPNETVLLSTHLLEEVEHFIGRALLLQKGDVYKRQAVLGGSLPLHVLGNAVPADVIGVLAELIVPVGGFLGVLRPQSLELLNHLSRAGGESAHNLGVKQVAVDDGAVSYTHLME